jgi:hypothetical protein
LTFGRLQVRVDFGRKEGMGQSSTLLKFAVLGLLLPSLANAEGIVNGMPADHGKTLDSCAVETSKVLDEYLVQKQAELKAWKRAEVQNRLQLVEYASGVSLLSAMAFNAYKAAYEVVLIKNMKAAYVNGFKKGVDLSKFLDESMKTKINPEMAIEEIEKGSSAEDRTIFEKFMNFKYGKIFTASGNYELAGASGRAAVEATEIAASTDVLEKVSVSSMKAAKIAIGAGVITDVFSVWSLLNINGTTSNIPDSDPEKDFCQSMTNHPEYSLNPLSAPPYLTSQREVSPDGEITKQASVINTPLSRMVTYCLVMKNNPGCFQKARAALKKKNNAEFVQQAKLAQYGQLSKIVSKGGDQTRTTVSISFPTPGWALPAAGSTLPNNTNSSESNSKAVQALLKNSQNNPVSQNAQSGGVTAEKATP